MGHPIGRFLPVLISYAIIKFAAVPVLRELGSQREVLEWANAAVALFEPEPSTGRRFFAAARDTISQYIAVDRIDHDLVADWLELRIVAFHNSFKYFYSGQLLARPRGAPGRGLVPQGPLEPFFGIIWL